MAKRPFRAMLALAAIMAAISLSPSCSRRTHSSSLRESHAAATETASYTHGETSGCLSLSYSDLRSLSSLLSASLAVRDSIHTRTHTEAILDSAGHVVSARRTETSDRWSVTDRRRDTLTDVKKTSEEGRRQETETASSINSSESGQMQTAIHREETATHRETSPWWLRLLCCIPMMMAVFLAAGYSVRRIIKRKR